MKPTKTLFATLLTWLLLAPMQVAVALDLNWNEVYAAEGVTVYRAEAENTKFFAFKGETVYDAEIGKVLHVLLDNEHRVEWVGRLYFNEVLESESPYDYVLYQAFELPAMFANRDYVYHGTVTEDDAGVLTLQMNSIEHDKAPETVGVRANLINSRYLLTPLEDGKTRIEVEILTDPKGWMPAWLVNIIQKSWPVDTLNGIRSQFDKDYAAVMLTPRQAAAEAAAAEAAAKAEAEAAAAEEAAEAGEGDDAEGEADAEGDDAEADDAEADDAEADDAEAPADTEE